MSAFSSNLNRKLVDITGAIDTVLTRLDKMDAGLSEIQTELKRAKFSTTAFTNFARDVARILGTTEVQVDETLTALEKFEKGLRSLDLTGFQREFKVGAGISQFTAEIEKLAKIRYEVTDQNLEALRKAVTDISNVFRTATIGRDAKRFTTGLYQLAYGLDRIAKLNPESESFTQLRATIKELFDFFTSGEIVGKLGPAEINAAKLRRFVGDLYENGFTQTRGGARMRPMQREAGVFEKLYEGIQEFVKYFDKIVELIDYEKRIAPYVTAFRQFSQALGRIVDIWDKYEPDIRRLAASFASLDTSVGKELDPFERIVRVFKSLGEFTSTLKTTVKEFPGLSGAFDELNIFERGMKTVKEIYTTGQSLFQGVKNAKDNPFEKAKEIFKSLGGFGDTLKKLLPNLSGFKELGGEQLDKVQDSFSGLRRIYTTATSLFSTFKSRGGISNKEFFGKNSPILSLFNGMEALERVLERLRKNYGFDSNSFTDFFDTYIKPLVDFFEKFTKSTKRLSDTINSGGKRFNRRTIGEQLRPIQQLLKMIQGLGKSFKGAQAITQLQDVSQSFGKISLSLKRLSEDTVDFGGFLGGRFNKNTQKVMSGFHLLGRMVKALVNNRALKDGNQVKTLGQGLQHIATAFSTFARVGLVIDNIKVPRTIFSFFNKWKRIAALFGNVTAQFAGKFRYIPEKKLNGIALVAQGIGRLYRTLGSIFSAAARRNVTTRSLTALEGQVDQIRRIIGLLRRSRNFKLDSIARLFQGLGDMLNIMTQLGEKPEKFAALSKFIDEFSDAFKKLGSIKVDRNVTKFIREFAKSMRGFEKLPDPRKIKETTEALQGLDRIQGKEIRLPQFNASQVNALGVTTGLDLANAVTTGILQAQLYTNISRGLTAAIRFGFTQLNPAALTRNLNAALNRTIQTARQIGREIAEAGERARQVGQELVQNFGIQRLFSFSGFTAAADFDALVTQLQVFGGLANEETEQLEELAFEIGRDYPLSALDGLNAAFDLLKAGLDPDEIQAALPNIADLTALSEEGNIETVSGILIAATNSFENFTSDTVASFEELGVAANIISAAADVSTGSVESIGQGLANVGPAARAAGLDLETTAAVLAIFDNNALRGAEGGTALRSVLDALARPQTQNALSALGISMFELNEQGENVQRDFVDVIGDIEVALDDMDAAERQAVLQRLADTFGRQGLNILLEQGADGIRSLVEEMGEVAPASERARDLLDNFKGVVLQLKGSIETLFIRAIVPLLDQIFRPMAEIALSVVNSLLGLNEGALTFISTSLVMVSTLATLVGGALVFFGALTQVGGLILSVTVSLLNFQLVGAAIFGVIGAIATGFLAIVAAAGILLPIVAGLTFAFRSIQRIFTEQIGTASYFARTFFDRVGTVFQLVGQILSNVGKAIAGIFSQDSTRNLTKFSNTIGSAFLQLRNRADSLIQILTVVELRTRGFSRNFAFELGIISNSVNAVISAFKQFGSNLGEQGLLASLTTFLDTLDQQSGFLIAAVLRIVEDLFRIDLSEYIGAFFLGGFSGGLELAATQIRNRLQTFLTENREGILDVLTNIFETFFVPGKLLSIIAGALGLTEIQKIFDDAIGGFVELFRSSVGTVLDLLSGISFAVALRRNFGIGIQVLEGFLRALRQFGRAVNDLFGAIFEALSLKEDGEPRASSFSLVGFLENILGAATTALTGLTNLVIIPLTQIIRQINFDSLFEFFKGLAEAFGNFFGSLFRGDLEGAGSAISDFFGTLASGIVNVGENILTSILNLLITAIPKIFSAIQEFLGNLFSGLVSLIGGALPSISVDGIVDGITGAFQLLSDSIENGELPNVFASVAAIISNLLFSAIGLAIGAVGQITGIDVSSILSNIESVLNANIETASKGGVAGVFGVVGNTIVGLLGTGITTALSTLNEVLGLNFDVSGILSTIETILESNIQAAEKGGAGGVFSAVANTILGFFATALVSAFTGLGGLLGFDVEQITADIQESFGGLLDAISSFFSGSEEEGTRGAFASIVDIVDDVLESLRGLFGFLNNPAEGGAGGGAGGEGGGIDIIQRLADALGELVSLSLDIVTDFINGITDLLDRTASGESGALALIGAVVGLIGLAIKPQLLALFSGLNAAAAIRIATGAGIFLLLDFIRNIITNITELDEIDAEGVLRGVLTAIPDTIQDILDLLGVDADVGAIFAPVTDFISSLSLGAVDDVLNIINAIKDFFSGSSSAQTGISLAAGAIVVLLDLIRNPAVSQGLSRASGVIRTIFTRLRIAASYMAFFSVLSNFIDNVRDLDKISGRGLLDSLVTSFAQTAIDIVPLANDILATITGLLDPSGAAQGDYDDPLNIEGESGEGILERVSRTAMQLREIFGAAVHWISERFGDLAVSIELKILGAVTTVQGGLYNLLSGLGIEVGSLDVSEFRFEELDDIYSTLRDTSESGTFFESLTNLMQEDYDPDTFRDFARLYRNDFISAFSSELTAGNLSAEDIQVASEAGLLDQVLRNFLANDPAQAAELVQQLSEMSLSAIGITDDDFKNIADGYFDAIRLGFLGAEATDDIAGLLGLVLQNDVSPERRAALINELRPVFDQLGLDIAQFAEESGFLEPGRAAFAENVDLLSVLFESGADPSGLLDQEITTGNYDEFMSTVWGENLLSLLSAADGVSLEDLDIDINNTTFRELVGQIIPLLTDADIDVEEYLAGGSMLNPAQIAQLIFGDAVALQVGEDAFDTIRRNLVEVFSVGRESFADTFGNAMLSADQMATVLTEIINNAAQSGLNLDLSALNIDPEGEYTAAELYDLVIQAINNETFDPASINLPFEPQFYTPEQIATYLVTGVIPEIETTEISPENAATVEIPITPMMAVNGEGVETGIIEETQAIIDGMTPSEIDTEIEVTPSVTVDAEALETEVNESIDEATQTLMENVETPEFEDADDVTAYDSAITDLTASIALANVQLQTFLRRLTGSIVRSGLLKIGLEELNGIIEVSGEIIRSNLVVPFRQSANALGQVYDNLLLLIENIPILELSIGEDGLIVPLRNLVTEFDIWSTAVLETQDAVLLLIAALADLAGMEVVLPAVPYGEVVPANGGVPGRATGGPVTYGRLYEILEKGEPEILRQNGRTYLMSAGNGYVVPASMANNLNGSAPARNVPVSAASGSFASSSSNISITEGNISIPITINGNVNQDTIDQIREVVRNEVTSARGSNLQSVLRSAGRN